MESHAEKKLRTFVMGKSKFNSKNHRRQYCASVALQTFIQMKHLENEGDRENIIDLLADIFHLCDKKKLVAMELFDTARQHWEEER